MSRRLSPGACLEKEREYGSPSTGVAMMPSLARGSKVTLLTCKSSNSEIRKKKARTSCISGGTWLRLLQYFLGGWAGRNKRISTFRSTIDSYTVQCAKYSYSTYSSTRYEYHSKILNHIILHSALVSYCSTVLAAPPSPLPNIPNNDFSPLTTSH